MAYDDRRQFRIAVKGLIASTLLATILYSQRAIAEPPTKAPRTKKQFAAQVGWAQQDAWTRQVATGRGAVQPNLRGNQRTWLPLAYQPQTPFGPRIQVYPSRPSWGYFKTLPSSTVNSRVRSMPSSPHSAIPPNQATIAAKWATQLDHDSFRVREAATDKLRELGKSALPVLRKVANDGSPEAQWRAAMLIREAWQFTLYTVTRDGRLVEIVAGESRFTHRIVAELGAPFDRDEVSVEGLAYSPHDHQLYAAANFADGKSRQSELYRISIEKGTATQLDTIANTEIDGLAFAPDGTLYGVASSLSSAKRDASLGQLVQICPGCATATTANEQFRFVDLDALAISPEGTLVVSDGRRRLGHTRLRSKMNSMRYLCRHAVYDAMQSIGGFEGMTFVNSHVVYALCASDSQARLIRFEPEGKAYHELGTLSFSALNLAAIPSGR